MPPYNANAPTLLIPGLLASSRLYEPVLPTLWRYGAVHIADHRRAASMAAIASGILADAPARFGLVGLSMGGYLAFEILRQAPERVERLALLNTSASPDSIEQTSRRRGLMALVRDGGFTSLPDLLFAPLVAPGHADDAALRETFRAMVEDTSAEAYMRQQEAIIARPDSRDGLGAIDCPTLVLVGADDTITPPDQAREITAGIVGSRLRIVPECGHLSTLEQPQAVARALEEWLSWVK